MTVFAAGLFVSWHSTSIQPKIQPSVDAVAWKAAKLLAKGNMVSKEIQNKNNRTPSRRNTAFRLYESFEFQVIQNVLVYRKDYGEIQD